MGGLEPPSKHSIQGLSTRLFRSCFSWQDSLRTPQSCPYLLNLGAVAEAWPRASVLNDTRILPWTEESEAEYSSERQPRPSRLR